MVTPYFGAAEHARLRGRWLKGRPRMSRKSEMTGDQASEVILRWKASPQLRAGFKNNFADYFAYVAGAASGVICRPLPPELAGIFNGAAVDQPPTAAPLMPAPVSAKPTPAVDERDPETMRAAAISAAWATDAGMRAAFAGDRATYEAFVRGVLDGSVRASLPPVLAALLADSAS